MNLPNKLTMFRIILIPVFLIFLLAPLPLDGQVKRYTATAIFCIASLTDLADGKIARKYNLVTNFGKFMDPLADKLLCAAAMIALIGMDDAVVALPSWIVILIISREFFITGFRTLAAEQNIVIAAGIWGKFKTTAQMIMIILLLLNFDNKVFSVLSVIFIVLSVLLTIISAADYIIHNKNVLKG